MLDKQHAIRSKHENSSYPFKIYQCIDRSKYNDDFKLPFKVVLLNSELIYILTKSLYAKLFGQALGCLFLVHKINNNVLPIYTCICNWYVANEKNENIITTES